MSQLVARGVLLAILRRCELDVVDPQRHRDVDGIWPVADLLLKRVVPSARTDFLDGSIAPNYKAPYSGNSRQHDTKHDDEQCYLQPDETADFSKDEFDARTPR